MPALVFDKDGERLYETGVKHCVLYKRNSSGAYPTGVAWNGITGISESPSGAEANPIWADDMKYLNLISREEFGASVTAYMYPDEFAECDGSAELTTGMTIGQQPRTTFGLCYRTAVGNDISGDAYGYKLHIIYGATATPSEKSYATMNDSPEAIEFSWELSTIPVTLADGKQTANVVIDSTKFTTEEQKANLKALLDVLYGTDASTEAGTTDTVARLPLPDEIKSILTGTTPEPDPDDDQEGTP